MRWKTVPYSEDDIRVITRFLFTPVTLENETRWLETAKRKQKLKHFWDGMFHCLSWVDVAWVND